MISVDGSYVTIHAILLFPIIVFAYFGLTWFWDSVKDIARAVYDDWRIMRDIKNWRDK